MEGFFILIIVGLLMLVISKFTIMLEHAVVRKQPCKLHKWHPYDSQGWLPTDFMDSPRLKESKLRCTQCLLEPNSTTNTVTLEDI